jgi:hypothetical protein
MNLQLRIEKIEQQMFTDAQWQSLAVYRRLLKRMKDLHGWSADKTIQHLTENSPDFLPEFLPLLTAKASGRLREADLALEQNIKNNPMSDEEVVKALLHRMPEKYGWTRDQTIEICRDRFPEMSEEFLTKI